MAHRIWAAILSLQPNVANWTILTVWGKGAEGRERQCMAGKEKEEEKKGIGIDSLIPMTDLERPGVRLEQFASIQSLQAWDTLFFPFPMCSLVFIYPCFR